MDKKTKKTKLHEKVFFLTCDCICKDNWLKDIIASQEEVGYKVSCINMWFSESLGNNETIEAILCDCNGEEQEIVEDAIKQIKLTLLASVGEDISEY